MQSTYILHTSPKRLTTFFLVANVMSDRARYRSFGAGGVTFSADEAAH